MLLIMKTDDSFYKKPFLFVFKNRFLSQVFIRLLFILSSTFYAKSFSQGDSASVKFTPSFLCLGALQRFGDFYSSGIVYFTQYHNQSVFPWPKSESLFPRQMVWSLTAGVLPLRIVQRMRKWHATTWHIKFSF